MADMHENIELLLERAVEPLAASVNLHCDPANTRAMEDEAQVDCAKPTFPNDSGEVPSHPHNLFPLEPSHAALPTIVGFIGKVLNVVFVYMRSRPGSASFECKAGAAGHGRSGRRRKQGIEDWCWLMEDSFNGR